MVRGIGLVGKWKFAAFAWLNLGILAASPASAAPSPGPLAASTSAMDVIDRAALAEPFVRTVATTSDENQALADALGKYRNRASSDDFSALTGFLASNPGSGWSAAVWTNLGLAYLHSGYFSRALDAWGQAWKLGKGAQAPEAKAIIDRAIGQRATLYASLGQFDHLQVLFSEIRNRPITGSATEQVQTARETLDLVNKDPRHLYLCGPKALKALLMARGLASKDVSSLDRYRATPRGTNLSQLADLATQKQLSYRLAFRRAGDPVPELAVVHWKVGHFAAVVGRANGRIHIVDPVIPGSDLWITAEALDAEASGFMLVPEDADQPAWKTVTNKEASAIWGKGPTNGTQPGRPGRPPANKNPTKGCPLCSYNIAESTVSVTFSDTPVGYIPAVGPDVRTVISYDQREDSQPANFSFFNVGQKWTLNWLSYVVDDPNNPGANVARFMSGGGQFYYSGYDATSGRFTAQDDDGSVLERENQPDISYSLLMPDGSVEVYGHSNAATNYPRNIFLTKKIDPQGNVITLNYDNQNRLQTIADSAGRQTTFSYSGPSRFLVTKITDPFGRSANLKYTANGQLSSITDIIGLTSTFGYDANALVNSLHTPYGTTTFAYTTPGTSGPPRFVDVTDPLGNHEREEWLEPAPIGNSEPSASVPVGMPLTPENDYLQYRNSFHWDKDQYVAAGCTSTGGCDYSKARVTHFLHFGGDLKSPVIESIKEPLEGRVWYQYPGQSDSFHTGTFDAPSVTARVLDDGTTQMTKSSYDASGFHNLIQSVDALGRTKNFTYSNGIDLQFITQKTQDGQLEVIAQYAYNGRHLPLTVVDASGQPTSYSYNASGQVLRVTDALGYYKKFEYSPTGNLLKIINANGVTSNTFTYDSYDRIATKMDSEGLTVAYEYDAADRVTTVSHGDGTVERYVYDKLDLASYQDRLGKVWRYFYDSNANLTRVTDPIGNSTGLTYSPNGHLTTMTDAKGNVTTWTLDVQGRPTSKRYADNTTEIYGYEATTSRMKSRTDPLGQVKSFSYALDDQISQVSYTNSVHPTATVSYTYDPIFGYRTSMTDGGGTTRYVYGPVGAPGALAVVQEQAASNNVLINYSYDELGRLARRTVSGAGTEDFQYDGIGRLTNHISDLGSFVTGYLGQTAQLTRRTLTGTSLKTEYSYLPNSGDRRLATIANTGLSASNYLYLQLTSNAGGQVTGVSESSDAATAYPRPSSEASSVNNLNQITSSAGQAYTYDANGNLISDGIRSYSWDAENRLLGITYSGQPSASTTFTYDGVGRRVSITSTPAGTGTPVSTFYVWCGEKICQARDMNHSVIRSYFGEGEFVPGSSPVSYYYGLDQASSVRRVFASNGLAPSYSYDAYGAPLQLTTPLTDFGYGGLFGVAGTGISLAQHRAYSSDLGRWLSEDPMGEGTDQNFNLYAYVEGDPISRYDPSGLCDKKQQCIDECTDLLLLPIPSAERTAAFEKCVRACMNDEPPPPRPGSKPKPWRKPPYSPWREPDFPPFGKVPHDPSGNPLPLPSPVSTFGPPLLLLVILGIILIPVGA